MKKYQVINYHHLLSQIDLQKVDKEARAQLISLDITLGDIVDAHNEEVEKIKARLTKGHEDTINEVSELIGMLRAADDKAKIELAKKIDANAEYASIQKQLNEEVNKRLLEDVLVEMVKIPSVDLAQWCADSGISINLDLLREFRKAGLTS
jgi:hypothetical protein